MLRRDLRQPMMAEQRRKVEADMPAVLLVRERPHGWLHGIFQPSFEKLRDALASNCDRKPARLIRLEGIVAKRRSSAYAGVLNDDWLKIRCLRVHDFVVGGWISDADKKIGALLLGEFIDGNLRYVGQVGSPSDWRVMRAVTRLLSPRATSPFSDAISDAAAKFCEPAFRAGVEFMDFTDDGFLRQPAFRRFSDEVISKIRGCIH